MPLRSFIISRMARPALGLFARMPPGRTQPLADRRKRHGMKAGLLPMRLRKSFDHLEGSLKSDWIAIRLRLPPTSSSHIEARRAIWLALRK